jgi:hypothetical protein
LGHYNADGRQCEGTAIFEPADRMLLGTAALAAISLSVILMVALGIAGPSSAVAAFPPAPPLPPWFMHVHPSAMLVSVALWLAVVLGGGGLALGLVAVRRGWRPRPGRLMLGSVVAVMALMVIPPMASKDMLLYVSSGRIAVLGHSPYVMTPGQLMASGDPVGKQAVFTYRNDPSRYGPVATGTEAAASELGGTSVARTLFWLKVWNALAYLAVVLALDRVVRSDAARRARAHLLWSVNPLMLFALLANGHNDVLAAAAGVTALFTLRTVNSRRGLVAGLLLGLATATKAPYLLFGAGLAWAARRSPRTLATLALGTIATLIPGYLIYGHDAITATTSGLASGEQPDLLWHEAARLLGWQHSAATTNTVGLLASVVLAAILLWRMPPGPRDLPAIRVALALTLGLLVASPKQYASYDAMLFPLLAAFPVSRMDWIAVARTAALAAASTPFLSRLDPAWLATMEKISIGGSPTLVLGVVVAVLLWLCYTREWKLASTPGELLIESAPAEPDGTRAPTT